MSEPIYLRIGERRFGPYAVEALPELAQSGAITPEAEFAPTPEGPWDRLGSSVLFADLFPADSKLKFNRAPPRYETVNKVSGSKLSHLDIIAAANRVRPPGPPKAPETGPTSNDVQEMVRRVAAAQSAKEGPFHLPKRKNRRLRDFLLIIIPLNAVMGTVAYRAGLQMTGLFACIMGFLALINGAVWWMLFVVMDRY